MNFIYHSKFLISFCMKLDLVVLDDVVVDALYSLMSMTSSSSIVLFFDSCLYSSSLYNSCIS